MSKNRLAVMLMNHTHTSELLREFFGISTNFQQGVGFVNELEQFWYLYDYQKTLWLGDSPKPNNGGDNWVRKFGVAKVTDGLFAYSERAYYQEGKYHAILVLPTTCQIRSTGVHFKILSEDKRLENKPEGW